MADLSNHIMALSPEKRALLAKQLQKKAAQQTAQTQAIPHYPQADSYPLSFAQEQLWFLDQFEPDSPLYNTPIAVRLEGSLRVDALEYALNEIMRRHEVLRATFPTVDGKPAQLISPFQPVSLETIDIPSYLEEKREDYAQQLMIEKSQKAFNLAHDLMMKSFLMCLNENDHYLLLIIHHIAIDGWSIGVLLNEVTILYQDYVAGRPTSLSQLPIQYTDFAQWQLAHLQGEELQKQMEYWRHVLDGELPVVEMPTDRPRTGSSIFHGAIYEFQLSDGLREKLHRVSQRYGVTLFMTLLTGLSTLLYRYTGQDDILIGTPIANRTHAELEGLIGFFANTLLLRVKFADDLTVEQLLKQVQEVTLGAYAHQDIPLEKIIKEIHSERNLSGTPLLQVMFVLQNSPLNAVEMPGLKLTTQIVDNGTSKFDLTFSLAEVNNELAGSIEYNTELFDATTIARMIEHFKRLLASITLDTEQPITTLPLLTPEERHTMLVQWNNTQIDYPQDSCLHQLFEQQVVQNPGQIAVISGKDKLSYEQLNTRANLLAHHLQTLGIGPDRVVGICFERSWEMIVSLVAILKAGGAYVALDPNYPLERLAFMVEDAQLPVLLTKENLLLNLPEHQAHVICLDRDWESIKQQPDTNPESGVSADNLVYMIYTSGSTGRPKGVLLNHRGRVNNFSDFNRRFNITQQDKLLAISSSSFDMSAYDVFGTLAAGATIVLPEASSERNPVRWAELIRQYRVTIWHSVPALLELLVDYLDDTGETEQFSLRLALLGGDWIPVTLPDRVKKLATHLQFISLGGATEASMDSTIYEVTDVDPEWKSIPYGRPMANQRCYILDTHLQPLPLGIPGELHLAGIGLARGYLHAPDITKEKFIGSPLPEEAGDHLYKTGDLARYMPDGNIELLGRIDNQVKIGGVRIELGEIESVLRQHIAVQNAIVVARNNAHAHKQLVAYVVPASEEGIESETLRRFMKGQLPESMVPSAFVVLDRLPLTPNGKIDRRNLPDPSKATLPTVPTFVAPRNPCEQTLAEIWAQVLHVEQIGVHDNFFAAGGDSILSIQVIARANNRGIHLTPKQLFQHQTIAELANIAEVTSIPLSEQVTIPQILPLTSIQKHFFLRQSVHLQGSNHIVQLETEQQVHPGNVQKAIAQLIKRHDALRIRFIKENEHWYQEVAPFEPEEQRLTLLDLSAMSVQEQLATLEGTIQTLQDKPVLAVDAAFNALLVLFGSHQPAHLLLSSHRLVMDTISWQILLDDLNALYQQHEKHPDSQLPAKTPPFSNWLHYLTQLANPPEVQQDPASWRNTPPIQHFAQESQQQEDDLSPLSTITQCFDCVETKVLLHDISHVYHADATELLLAVLTQALASQAKTFSVLIELERDGRQLTPKGQDFSHTVGQFTISYPVRLLIKGASTGIDTLALVKEQLRRQSDDIYSSEDTQDGLSQSMAQLPQAEITFTQKTIIQASEEASGFKLLKKHIQSGHHLAAKLNIEWSVVDEQLQITWRYDHTTYTYTAIEAITQEYKQGVEALINAYHTHVKRGLVPSDFPLSRLSQQQIDHLQMAQPPIEDIYPLSSQQSMMLKHSIQKPGSGIYVIHVNYVMDMNLNIPALQQAWQTIIQRYSVLRSSFAWEGLEQPVQIVHPDVQIPIAQYDWRQLSASEQLIRLDTLIQEDRQRGYDLAQIPLMRLFVIRLTDQSYEYIWSNHHILLDGWSRSSIQQEVFVLYSQLCQQQNVQFPYTHPFKDYIEWLHQQDIKPTEVFWRQNLSGFKTPTPLIANKGRVTEDLSFGKQKIFLSIELTNTLQSFTRQHFLTLNTLVLGAWILLLGRYTREPEVLMGITTSARPASFPDIETVVGLLSNTIPLRIKVTPETQLFVWLKELQTLQVDLRQYEYRPWQQVQSWSELPQDRPMFESYLVFENYPWDFQILSLENLNIDATHPLSQKDYTIAQTEFPLRLDAVPGANLILAMSYYRTFFDDEVIASMLNDWRVMLERMLQYSERKLADILKDEDEDAKKENNASNI